MTKDQIVKITSFFEDRLIIKKESQILNKALNANELFILQQIGLPNSDELSFIFDENAAYLQDKYIQIGVIGSSFANGNPIVIDAESRNILLLNPKPTFINSSVEQFLKSIYEFEHYLHTIQRKKVFGVFNENRKSYAQYLTNKLEAVDENIYHRDYYWLSYVEQIEIGGI